MKDLNNKVVWITGASSGIGEALAIAFASKNSRLVLSARRVSELERVRDACSPAQVLVLPMDMEDTSSFEAKFQQVLAHFGTVDILINNAGISQRGNALDTKFDVYQKLINLNYLSVVALTKTVLPHFVAQGSGHFVAISSVSGKIGTAMRSGYAASKHALHGFYDALRAESTKSGIQVSIVCPGYIRTNISLNALSPEGTAHGKMDNNQAQGLPADVCAAKIIAAIQKNKSEVYIGGKEVMGIYLKRYFPWLLEKILKNESPS